MKTCAEKSIIKLKIYLTWNEIKHMPEFYIIIKNRTWYMAYIRCCTFFHFQFIFIWKKSCWILLHVLFIYYATNRIKQTAIKTFIMQLKISSISNSINAKRRKSN